MTDLDRIQTHARSILEGEGQDEHDPALLEAVARAIAEAYHFDPDAISPKAAEAGHRIPEYMFFGPAAQAALSTIRKHEESRHD